MTCKTDDECENDTYCDPAVGCVPWDTQSPPYDPNCVNVIAPGVFPPKVRCEFNAAPAGDPFPIHVDVQGTPIVVNFNNPGSSGPPSIVAPFTATVPGNYTEDLGVLRVLRGTDCTLEANLGGRRPRRRRGDRLGGLVVHPRRRRSRRRRRGRHRGLRGRRLDARVHAEERDVVAALEGALPRGRAVVALQHAPVTAARSAGPARRIYDIDDDGKPEVIREGVVFGADGTLKSLQPAGYQSYSQGDFSVIANLDQDPQIELTNGQLIWKWTNGAWVSRHRVRGPGGAGVRRGRRLRRLRHGRAREQPRDRRREQQHGGRLRDHGRARDAARRGAGQGRRRAADGRRLRRRRAARGRRRGRRASTRSTTSTAARTPGRAANAARARATSPRTGPAPPMG